MSTSYFEIRSYVPPLPSLLCCAASWRKTHEPSTIYVPSTIYHQSTTMNHEPLQVAANPQPQEDNISGRWCYRPPRYRWCSRQIAALSTSQTSWTIPSQRVVSLARDGGGKPSVQARGVWVQDAPPDRRLHHLAKTCPTFLSALPCRLSSRPYHR